MRKLILVFAVVLGVVGCKTVDVSIPIPIRVSGTAEFHGSEVLYVVFGISTATLGAEISEHAEEEQEIVIDLESVVLVVSRKGTGCQADSIKNGEVKVNLGSEPDTLKLASVAGRTMAAGDTLSVELDSTGVNTLARFTRKAIEGSSEILTVVVDGNADSAPVDFDLKVIFTFTLVVTREMTSIGF